MSLAIPTTVGVASAAVAWMVTEIVMYQRVHHPEDGNIRSLTRAFVWAFAIGTVLYILAFIVLAYLRA